MIRLVPQSYRQAALALGAPRWKTIQQVVLPAAKVGIVTAGMLAVARAAGETAPLLFTALGNRFWSLRMDQPIATLPVFIYDYAKAPYTDWNRQAWTGALVLVLLVTTICFSCGLPSGGFATASLIRNFVGVVLDDPRFGHEDLPPQHSWPDRPPARDFGSRGHLERLRHRGRIVHHWDRTSRRSVP
jgi:hypothetical protein